MSVMIEEFDDMFSFINKVKVEILAKNPCIITYGMLKPRTLILKEYYEYSVN
ncbi:MAG: hypothetical protein PHY33_07620 [Methanobacteriaceae archaeon]|nr:hypothetical protein [Methanobacteriaceae archaeon]